MKAPRVDVDGLYNEWQLTTHTHKGEPQHLSPNPVASS